MTALQTTVYKFFTDSTGVRSQINTAILAWQHSQGYIAPSITMNWMAIAQDNDIHYIGDLDMQNGFATGRYSIASTAVYSFTVHAADGFGILVGFQPDFAVGSIDHEPFVSNACALAYSRLDEVSSTINFHGDITGLISGLTMKVNGVTTIPDTPWVYDGTPGIDLSAAGWTSRIMPTVGDYLITWG
jgi:hypothetical protein